MNKIIRFYNQNRIAFWIIIVIIIFFIIILQLINHLVKVKNENKNTDMDINISNTEYVQESTSIISGGSISKKHGQEYGKLIDNFLSSCIEHNYEIAYSYLSDDCKQNYYDSIEKFERLYCENKFEGNKTYSFQLWSAGGENIYQVKIFNNMLSTGIESTNKYIEDFYTVVYENGNYKLNINGFIDSDNLNSGVSLNGITIKIEKINKYKEYFIYNVKIKNDTDNTILLDTRKKTNTTFLMTSNGTKLYALLYENLEKDLIVNSKEEKEIKIKFNVTYRNDIKIDSMNFTDIIDDYNKYKEDSQYDGNVKIKLNM